jgi:hypothetical protein
VVAILGELLVFNKRKKKKQTNRAFGNWNALPSLIVNAENVSQFKKRYDQHKGNHD